MNENGSTALATRPDETPTLTAGQMELVRETIFPDSTDGELQLYLHDCKRQNVHPLDRLIHPTIRTSHGKRRYVAITSIDLMRSRADATGHYAGNEDPIFVGEEKTAGFKATVTVWKMVEGQRCPFTASARWFEYKPDEDWIWQKMPNGQLGKVAEALALRKGFPRQLHSLYIKEEMEQADNRVPAPAPQPEPQAASAAPTPQAPPRQVEAPKRAEHPAPTAPGLGQMDGLVTSVRPFEVNTSRGKELKYWINFGEGSRGIGFSTWNKKHADVAETAQKIEAPVRISYEENHSGGKLYRNILDGEDSVKIIERQPGDDMDAALARSPI